MAPEKLIKMQILILRVWSGVPVAACLTHSQKAWTLLLQGPPTKQEGSRTAVPDKSESSGEVFFVCLIPVAWIPLPSKF